MNAKCYGTSKYLPLLKVMQLKNPEQLRSFIEKYFSNADELYNGLMGDILDDSPQNPIMEVQEDDARLGKVISDESTSLTYLYGGKDSKREKMKNRFVSKMVSLSIYDLSSKEIIDSESIINGISLLNDNIFKYKIELLNNIANYLNRDDLFINTNLKDENELTKMSNAIISLFEIKVSKSEIDDSLNFDDAFDNYVIFSRFDEILKLEAPFIDIKAEYKNTKSFFIDKYVYKGPKVRHRTGYTTNEFVGIESGMSDLSKILLNYFPEVNSGQIDITGSSIGIEGFNEIISKINKAVHYNPRLQHLSSELNKGINANYQKILTEYLINLEGKNIVDSKYVSIYHNKIRGLIKYIFSNEMNPDIKDMFTHLAHKVVKSEYLLISKNQKTKQVESLNLNERQLSIQRNRLMDAMAAAVYQFRNNPKLYEQLKTKHNIIITNDNIIINEISNKIPNSSVVNYYYQNKWKFEVNGQLSNKKIFDLSYDFLSRVLPSNLSEVLNQLNEESTNLSDVILPLISTVILASEGKSKFNITNKLVDMSPYISDIVPLADALSIVEGSNTVTVIKNPDGNNLPNYQMVTLSTSIPKLINRIGKQSLPNRDNIMDYNPLYRNFKTGFLGPPSRIIGITLRGINKSITDMSTAELISAEVFYNFYNNIDSGTIYLQPTTYSDKSSIYVNEYNIRTPLDETLNIQKELQKFLGKKGNLSKIYKASYQSRQDQINILVKNILKDYSQAFNREFKTIEEVNKYISKMKAFDIQEAFLNSGVKTFYENIHAYTDYQGNTRINESIEFDYKIGNSSQLFETQLEIEKRNFLKDLIDSNFIIPNDINIKIGAEWIQNGNVLLAKAKKNNQYYDIYEKINEIVDDHSIKLELHPILEAYFATDTFLSHNYNALVTGNPYGHKNQSDIGDIGSDKYAITSAASRWTANIKRQVIHGATAHIYAQGLKNGVLPIHKAAIILDEKAECWNMMGMTENVDTMDGGAFTTSVGSRMANNSLMDAAVGRNKKTIFHYVDQIYNTQIELKWAEFEITNEIRRMSNGSKFSGELITKKMFSEKFNRDLDLNRFFKQYSKDIYFKDWITNQYYKITNITQYYDTTNNQLVATRELQRCDSQGNIIGVAFKDEPVIIDTLYNIDQLFGGAWSMEIEGDRLIFNEANVDLLENVIYEYDLRDKQILWLVNKSAIKVGAGNVNPQSKFSNDELFTTIDMSTEFGGVQLNPDHELDTSDVTEMTQMINALEQNGFSHEFVNGIYTDIAKVIEHALKDINIAINSNDKEKVYRILADQMINAFGQGDKDMIGLAQSFVTLSEKSLRENNLEYVMPFSAATINGAFVSTVASNLTKIGIRRKYSGAASTQVPGHNMIQYYNFNGQTMDFNDFLDIVEKSGIQSDGKRSAVEIAINDVFINGRPNPFIKGVVNLQDLDFEDTIVIFNPSDLTQEPIVETLNTIEKYYQFRYLTKDPNLSYGTFTSKAKNLKGMNVKFVVNGQKEFSLYDIDSVRVSHIINKKNIKTFGDLNESDFALVSNVMSQMLNITPLDLNMKIDKENLTKLCNSNTQKILQKLSSSKNIPYQISFGNMDIDANGEVNISDVIVNPAQIVMGKLHAKKLGLEKGDTINKIRLEKDMFFYNRLKKKYQIENINLATFDVVLFTSENEQFYVKFDDGSDLSQFNLSPDPEIKIIDNNVFYKGNKLCNADEKIFRKYTDVDGNSHHLIIISNLNRINELKKSNFISSYKLNYTEQNKDNLFEFQFRNRLDGTNKPVKVSFQDANGEIHDAFIKKSSQVNWRQLQNNESLLFDDRLRILSKNRYEGFEKSLLMIGARVPTQSMQSFAPMEIVMFTDSDINDVYIPRHIMWLTGSDYDIDKVFLMSYSLNKDGEFNTMSELGKKYNIDQVLQLEVPNGKYYQKSDNGYIITIDDINEFRRGNLSIFNKIYNSEFDSITFNEYIDNEYQYEFMKDLNTHSNANYDSNTIEEGLKNKIVNGIFKVITNPISQINLHNPISMKEQKEIANKSTVGESDKTRRPDNPASKFVVQYQAGVGKNVIGVMATCSKSYLMMSNYYNNQYSKITNMLKNKEYENIVKLLEQLVFTNPYDGKLGILANINLDNIMEMVSRPGNTVIPYASSKFRMYNVGNDQFNLLQFITDLKERANVPDALLSISGLISAATDNMKELILAKINATSEFADIYGYLIQVGISFGEVAAIMTSPAFNYITKLTTKNIFKSETDNFNLNSAVSFYLGTNVLPFVQSDTLLKSINDYYKDIGQKEITFLRHDILLNDKFIIDYQKWLRNSIIYSNYNDQDTQDPTDDITWVNEDDLDYNSEEYGSKKRKKPKRNFNINPITNNEKIQINTFLQYVLERNKNVKLYGKKEIEIINRILPHVQEMKIMGKFGSINQGIKTDKYEFYSFVKTIESFMNKKITTFNEKGGKQLSNISLFNNFDENTYEYIKESHNIVNVIKNIPHFAEMLRTLNYNNYIVQNSAIRNRLELEFANILTNKDNSRLNKQEFSELVRYVNDVLIYNWLKNETLEIEIPVGTTFYMGNQTPKENKTEKFKINLSTLNGQASFKRLMDEYIIPSLQNDEKYRNNKFISNLMLGVRRGEFNPNLFWKPTINMLQIDSSVINQTIYEQMLTDFNKLNGQEFLEWNIVDLFYMYNLLTHKDAISQNSFTRIFQDIIQSYPDLMVSRFNKFLSDIDYGTIINLDYNITDIKYRLAMFSRNFEKFDVSLNNENITVDNTSLNLNLFNTSHFTLNMPYMNIPSSKVKQIKLNKKEPRNYYEKPINKVQIFKEMVERVKGQIHLHSIDEFELTDPTRNANAYIENGEVHIISENSQLTSPLHEFTHIVMAGMKFEKPEVYYSLLSQITTHPKYKQLYEELARNSMYDNKHGSDIDEEIFARILEDYYANKIYGWTQDHKFGSIDEISKELVNEILGVETEKIDLHEIMNMPVNEILESFKSVLIDWDYSNIAPIKLNQELSTLKNELFKDGVLEEKCD